MTEALAFDTHRFVKRLVEHGFTQQQAEVLSEEQVQLLDRNLVTKTDFETGLKDLKMDLKDDIRGLETGLKDLETDFGGMKTDISGMKTDIKNLETDLGNMKADIKDLEIHLIKWMMAGFIAQGGLIVALVKLL